MDGHLDLVEKAIELCGGQTAVANDLRLKQPSVFRWTVKGLPRTECSNETNYSDYFEKKSGGKVTAQDLISSLKKFKNSPSRVSG